MVRIKWIQILCWCCFCFSIASCAKDDPVEPESVDRTILIYMAADNSLSGDGYNNIRSILNGMQQGKGRVVIYFDAANDVPRLMTIKGGKGCVLDTLETYPEENSASPEVFSRVVKDTRRLFPASSYGLILWSHGMAWLPGNYSFPRRSALRIQGNMPRTKYFGEDWHQGSQAGSSIMGVKELTEAMPEGFSFVLFDACFMSSIEVIYQLRNKTDYIISSPAEIISEGFPYDKIVPFLWGEEEDLKQICQAFFNYYNTHKNGGAWHSATIALVKTAGLESLAQNMREILVGKTDFSSVWSYPLSQSSLPDVFFDLGEFARSKASDGQYAAFKASLDRVVVYKVATANLFDVPVPADKFSGISSYIPLQNWQSGDYFTFDWPKAVY